MRIQNYKFGHIKIDGKTFNSDVIILPDRVEGNWWRSEGHRLIPSDLPLLHEEKPDILLVGRGKFGCMEISDELEKYLEELRVELLAYKTDKAVEIYNDLWHQGKIKLIAAMHLTC